MFDPPPFPVPISMVVQFQKDFIWILGWGLYLQTFGRDWVLNYPLLTWCSEAGPREDNFMRWELTLLTHTYIKNFRCHLLSTLFPAAGNTKFCLFASFMCLLSSCVCVCTHVCVHILYFPIYRYLFTYVYQASFPQGFLSIQSHIDTHCLSLNHTSSHVIIHR